MSTDSTYWPIARCKFQAKRLSDLASNGMMRMV
jgi:hypothetical protein